MTTLETTTQPHPNGRPRWLLPAVAAAAIALLAVGLVVVGGDDDPAPSEPSASTLPAPSTTTIAVPSEQALTEASAYLAAFAGGDPESVVAMQTDDFVFRSAFPGDTLGEQHFGDFFGIAYQSALGTTFEEPDCQVVTEDADAALVTCAPTLVTTIHELTATPGIPTRIVVEVTPAGIRRLDLTYLQNVGLLGFYEWRDVQPSAPTIDPTTADENAELGRQDAQFAGEYVDFGIATVQATFAAFNGGDVEDFMGRFGAPQDILGLSPDAAPAALDELVAAGARFDVTSCEPAGIVDLFDLRIECDAAVTASGPDGPVDVGGTVTALVDIEGVIVRNDSTVDLTALGVGGGED